MSAPSAFTRALQRFQDGLTPAEIAQFQVATINDVWDMADKLQTEQSARHLMQNMARIEPFISGLTRYASVIEVFVQVKPDIMAFIWVAEFPSLRFTSIFGSVPVKLTSIGAIESVTPGQSYCD